MDEKEKRFDEFLRKQLGYYSDPRIIFGADPFGETINCRCAMRDLDGFLIEMDGGDMVKRRPADCPVCHGTWTMCDCRGPMYPAMREAGEKAVLEMLRGIQNPIHWAKHCKVEHCRICKKGGFALK